MHQNTILTLLVCTTWLCNNPLFCLFFSSLQASFCPMIRSRCSCHTDVQRAAFKSPLTQQCSVWRHFSRARHSAGTVCQQTWGRQWFRQPGALQIGGAPWAVRLEKRKAPTEAPLPMPPALIHVTNANNKQSTLEEIWPGSINGYKNSMEDSLAIFIDIVNASTLRFTNSIFRIRYTCICLK